MAALPSPTQVAGGHGAIYEAYYQKVDPKGNGTIGAADAAKFLKKSGLSDVVLSRVWDLSDPAGRGFLDKVGLFVALKLVALAQAGHDVSMRNIGMETPPPKVGNIPKVPPKPPAPLISTTAPILIDWTIKSSERVKYDQLFDSLQPSNGMIPGNKVKGVLMDSKLPLETLGRIWDLADQDKDGMLDRHEFIVAMHLVYKALEKHAIPASLPPELLRPPKQNPQEGFANFTQMSPPLATSTVLPEPITMQPLSSSAPLIAPAVAPLVAASAAAPIAAAAPLWVVPAEDITRSDILFKQCDIDKDGLVSGLEVRDVFLQSGVPQPCLAHIWGLCDAGQSGKLTAEQFALAMWLIQQKLAGIEPPQALSPNMIPPSQRTEKENAELVSAAPTYSNPELDMISKDIEELAKERRILETDITQKEADIKIKSGEVKSLQSELDTLAATFKQLENQKGEAQKRLNDLKAQRTAVDTEMAEVDAEIEVEQEKVDKLRTQAEQQEESLKEQEGELNSKKMELQGLKDEETKLQTQHEQAQTQLQDLTKNLQDMQLQISQTKAQVSQLEECQRQIKDAVALCESALAAGDAIAVPQSSLEIQPDFRESAIVNGNSPPGEQKDRFSKANDPFSMKSQTNGNSFGTPDPFKEDLADPFKSANGFASADPFAKQDAFANDPFGSSAPADPFASDPFGDKSTASKTAIDAEKDPFGCDPFAVLHAPTRAESPSPALPPKKSKQPPPRPAPPKQGPARPPPPQTQHHPPATQGFADFADFDSKHSSSTLNTTSSATLKLADFTDDPFRDYRYEDPFSIADPFSDDQTPPGTNSEVSPNNNASSPGKTVSKSTGDLVDAFDEQFNAFNTPNNNKSDAFLSKTDAKSLDFDSFLIKSDEFDAFSSATSKSASNFDAFSPNKNSKYNTFSTKSNIAKSDSKSVDLFGLDSFDSNFNFNSNSNTNSKTKSKTTSANNGRLSVPLSAKELPNKGGRVSAPTYEDAQMAWAAAESLKAEEDRKRREKQEQEDYELALAISRGEKNL